MEKEVKDGWRPECKLIGENGNIFNLMGIASGILKHHGMCEKAAEMRARICASGSYDEALCIIAEYVDVV